MSAIIFHSKSQGKAMLHGAERHHMGMCMRKYGYELNMNWAAVDRNSENSLLNACMHRSDPLTLMMRIHAQCESHCWVDGPNRTWLADIIAQGRACGLYQTNVGWGEVEAFLRARNDEPVFLSFSITEPFPSEQDVLRAVSIRVESQWGKWLSKGGPDDEADVVMIPGRWQDLSPAHQWSLHEQVLREESKREDEDPDAPFSRELRPSNWKEYFFE